MVAIDGLLRGQYPRDCGLMSAVLEIIRRKHMYFVEWVTAKELCYTCRDDKAYMT